MARTKGHALVRMSVHIHSSISADAFASLSAFSKISRILCVRVRIPDRILIPGLGLICIIKKPDIELNLSP